MTTEVGVVGTYKAALQPLWFAWGGLALALTVPAAANLLDGETLIGGMQALMACAFAVNLWAARSGRTVISADGIAVKRQFKWRRYSWDEVESVANATFWSPEPTLRVRISGGQLLPLDVPAHLYDQFVAYARAHRSAPPPPRTN